MSEKKLLDDCFLHDRDRLKHADVLDLLEGRLVPLTGTESVPLLELTGRIAASDVFARRPVPPADNAAVDGYAFAHADYLRQDGRFAVSVRLPAGHNDTSALSPGTAARIFTGAHMPPGAETVAMQEDCTALDDAVTIPTGLKAGANCRKAGEDITAGDRIVSDGQRLRPQDVAALAADGHDSAVCRAPLSVVVFSSGDELADAGSNAGSGQIFDANTPMLMGLLEAWGYAPFLGGRLPDEPGAVTDALRKAAMEHHAVVTTGGASRGEEDHMIDALAALGKRHLWQLAIKPGRPMLMGQIDDTVVFGLPGNPVAVFVCALLYLRPGLARLGGGQWPAPLALRLPAAFDLKSKPDRREFLRGIPVIEGGDLVAVDKYPRDGSGLISGLRASGGLIEIPEDTTRVTKGEPVRFLPYAGFGIGG